MDEKLMEEDEADCIRRAQNGDGAAFETLFHTYYSMIFALSYNMTGRHHDAEEVVQEAFIKAARALPRFRRDSSFKTWLYRIAMNTGADFRRKRRDDIELDESLAAPRPEMEQHPLGEALRLALDSLSIGQRQAIVLTYFDGLNHAETASILRCAETTVSWRVFTAKRKLRKILACRAAEEGGRA